MRRFPGRVLTRDNVKWPYDFHPWRHFNKSLVDTVLLLFHGSIPWSPCAVLNLTEYAS